MNKTITVGLSALFLLGCEPDQASAPHQAFQIDGGRAYVVPGEELDVWSLMEELEDNAGDPAAVRRLAAELGQGARGPAGVDEIVATVPELESGWWTLDEGEYVRELLFLGDDCGGGFDFDPEPPGEPPPGALVFNTLVFDSTADGFTQGTTFPGEAERPEVFAHLDVQCTSHGPGYACPVKVNEVPGTFAAPQIGGPFDATIYQSIYEAGLFQGTDEFIEIEKFSNECVGPECEEFIVAMDIFLGFPASETFDCTYYSGGRQVLDIPTGSPDPTPADGG